MHVNSCPTHVLRPQEMGSRHRARPPVIQIIKTATVPPALCKRDSVKQFHDSKIKFPLTRRSIRYKPAAAARLWGKMRRLAVAA